MTARLDDDVINALWPADQARLLRRRARHGEAQWWLLPHFSRPSLALPTQSPTAAAALSSRRAVGVVARAKQATLVAALSSPYLHLLPLRKLTAQRRPDDIEATLSGTLGQPVRVAAFMGPPRANRKAVLRVTAGNGATVAYAKVGHNELTRALVEAEHANITCVQDLVPQQLQVPPVLAKLDWRGNTLLITGALEGGRSPVSKVPPVEPTIAVATMSGTRSFSLAASPVLSGWHMALENLPESAIRGSILAGIERLQEACGDTSILHGCWHGDWTPWNLSTRASDWCVWDWERFGFDVPVGFDAIHYMAATTDTDAAQSRHWADDARRDLASYGVTRGTENIVMAAYFIHISIRYAADLTPRLTRLQERVRWSIYMMRHSILELELQ